MTRRNNNQTNKQTAKQEEPKLETTQPEVQKAAEEETVNEAAEQADVAVADPTPTDSPAEEAVADAQPAKATDGPTPAPALVETMERYLDAMSLGREIDPRVVGVPMQRQLAIAVVAAVAEPDRKQFQVNMRYLLENIREHRTGVFSDSAIFRWYDIAGIKNRREIEAILVVLTNTLESENRQRNAKMLLGGDFTRRLNPVRAEQIARNLRSFYNVTA